MSKGNAYEIQGLIRNGAFCLAFCLLGSTPHQAHAGEDKGAAIPLAALICIDPATGDESRIQLAKGLRDDCPEGHTRFIAFEVEQSPAADPLTFELPEEQQEQAEVGDAPMDQQ